METPGTAFQNEIGKPSHDNARLPAGNIKYYPALCAEYGSLHRIVIQQSSVYGLFILLHGAFAQPALLRSERDKLPVIELHPQPLCQQFPDMMPATTVFT